MKSTLSPYAALMREPDTDAAWNFCKAKWHGEGVAVFMPDLVDKQRGFLAAQEVRNLAEQCYGKRNG